MSTESVVPTLAQLKNEFQRKLYGDWNLNSTYRFYLNSYYILKWDTDYLISNIEGRCGNYTLKHNGVIYKVIWHNTQETQETQEAFLSGIKTSSVLLSFRVPSPSCKFKPVVLIKNYYTAP
jgi:hypothetical protein